MPTPTFRCSSKRNANTLDCNNAVFRIPLVARASSARESEYAARAAAAPSLGGGGPFTRACERLLQSELRAPKAILTSSCTSALHLAAVALGIGPGDEVVVPSYAFASCASVFLALGATPVFADSREDGPDADDAAVEAAMSPRTRCVLVVHYAGLPCRIDRARRAAAGRGVAVIEDAAHALFARDQGRALGTLGTFGAVSFDHAKNVTCGEGGALFVNDASYVPAVEIAYERGTNRAALFRGECDSYEWVGAGAHCAPSELQAAFLLGQLEDARAIYARRARMWRRYAEGLREWAAREEVRLPHVPAGAEPSWHLFYLVFRDAGARERVRARLAARGIESAPHYVPLHLSPAGRRLGGRPGLCPRAERYGAGLLRIPLHGRLEDRDLDEIIDTVTAA